jgi:membrane peptidoglycan carboxypeptidase
MSELLSSNDQARTGTPDEQPASEAPSRVIHAPTSAISSPARAKITVPLHADRPPTPRITRPLAVEKLHIQAVTPALSSSLLQSSITRPLVSQVALSRSLSSLPDAKITRPLAQIVAEEVDDTLMSAPLPTDEQNQLADLAIPYAASAQPTPHPLPGEQTPILALQPALQAQQSALPPGTQPTIPAAYAAQQRTGSLAVHIPHTTLRVGIQQRKLKRIYRLQYFTRKHLRRARVSDRRERRRLWTTIWTTMTSLLLLFLVIGGVVSYIAYNFIITTQGTYASQVLTLRNLLPSDNLKIYDSQGSLIDQMTDQGIHTEVPYAQIAPALVDATVAIEDRTFWQNSGVDITGILRAAFADLESGEPLQGGSTITQQLIKKLLVGDSTDVTRKLAEVVLAPQINNHYSKQDIMEMYLNTIYYGHQAYGIDAAATVYFGLEDKSGQSAATQLDLAQAAFLAGLPRNASLYDPAINFTTASNRFYAVLQAMVAQHSITQVQAQAAYQEGQAPGFFKSSPTLQDQAPHFDEYLLTQLEQMYHLTRSQLSRSGLVVYTTLNLALQKQILTIMQQHIAEIRDAHHVTNAAEVLIDFHTGAIISMLGSIDYNNRAIDGQYNVALAYRQPGSSFKPYVYVTAFAQGASPAQAVDDASTTFHVPDSNPPTYTPSNYDQHFHGHMTLRCALQNSLNVPAVRVLQHVGISNAMTTAQAMGITSYKGTPGLSLVLGGLDVRLLDHTSAMGVFANSGVRQPYFSISKIVQGTTGKVLFQHQTTVGTQVISPQLAYMMTNVLSDNTSRTPEFFDCNVLQLYANSQQDCYNGNRGAIRPAAAKTGTTQDFRDNWTVGYTTDYVMGVWAGNDDNSPMINVTGVQGAAPIWHDAMLLAEQGHPMQDFQNPGGLQRATVTYPDGVTSSDWFLPGTVPTHSKPAPTPDPGQGHQSTTATPYCSTFSYAFQPPSAGGIPANGSWW